MGGRRCARWTAIAVGLAIVGATVLTAIIGAVQLQAQAPAGEPRWVTISNSPAAKVFGT
jgi:hypothetical protein